MSCSPESCHSDWRTRLHGGCMKHDGTRRARRRTFAQAATRSAVLLFALCAACADQGKLREAEIDSIAAWFSGDYDNSEQVREEVASGKGTVHPQIEMHIVPIGALMIGKVVFYEQQNDGNNPRRILRQRLHRFEPSEDGKSIIHAILAFRAPARWANGYERSDIFKSIQPDDVVPATCILHWTAGEKTFVGSNEDTPCRSGAGPAAQTQRAHYELSDSTLTISEQSLNGKGEVVPERSFEFRF